jgi:hypothetical protein
MADRISPVRPISHDQHVTARLLIAALATLTLAGCSNSEATEAEPTTTTRAAATTTPKEAPYKSRNESTKAVFEDRYLGELDEHIRRAGDDNVIGMGYVICDGLANGVRSTVGAQVMYETFSEIYTKRDTERIAFAAEDYLC